jgi:glycosyltransferase involved in cell wall biosynthesis
MSDPTVCCLLLTADRQGFTDRAVQCFLDQTYRDAYLFIYDTGCAPYRLDNGLARSVVLVRNESQQPRQIGALRNEAIDMVKADIIMHWDSDDWSAPERVDKQVQILGIHKAHGFYNLLFLDTRRDERAEQERWDKFLNDPARRVYVGGSFPVRRAWEYDYKKFLGNRGTEHVLGSSLVYWRDTWKGTPFSGTAPYEDPDWCKRVPMHATNGIGTLGVDTPLLIAEVHGGNTSGSYAVFDKHQQWVNPEWRRAPEWDQYCSERLYP